MKHDENEHWWLVEDGKGQVGYEPVVYLMIIIDTTPLDEKNDTTRQEGHTKRTDGTNIGGEMGQDRDRKRRIQRQWLMESRGTPTIYVEPPLSGRQFLN